jgi:hypothetical protein
MTDAVAMMNSVEKPSVNEKKDESLNIFYTRFTTKFTRLKNAQGYN